MMFSTTTGEGTSQTIEALDLGAIDFIKKPEKYRETSGEDFATQFLKILERGFIIPLPFRNSYNICSR